MFKNKYLGIPTINEGEIVLFFTDFVFHLSSLMRRWLQIVGGFSNAQLDPLFASENRRKYSQILGLFHKGLKGQSLLQYAAPDTDGNFHTGLGEV